VWSVGKVIGQVGQWPKSLGIGLVHGNLEATGVVLEYGLRGMGDGLMPGSLGACSFVADLDSVVMKASSV
jgi:hypothetical protein